MLKTNCIRQPQSYFPVHLATTIHALNSLITAVLPSPGYNFLTATLKFICNDSFIGLLVYCGCKINRGQLPIAWVALCN